jgi:hypothetical protein
MSTFVVELTDAERDSVLAGLRMLQAAFTEGAGSFTHQELVAIASDSGTMLTPDELEDLIQEINCV